MGTTTANVSDWMRESYERAYLGAVNWRFGTTCALSEMVEVSPGHFGVGWLKQAPAACLWCGVGSTRVNIRGGRECSGCGHPV